MSGPFRAVDGDVDHGTAPRHTEEQIVGRQTFLVIQGAADISTDWRDIEKLRDCDYSRRVFPVRLIEYQRGDCASVQFTDYRIVRREIIDREYPHNNDSTSS